MIDLLPSAEQQQLVEGIAAFLREQLPVERHRTDARRRGRAERELWGELAAMGCFALSLPEEAGGVGYTLAEEVLVFREYGRALVTPSVLATVLAARIAWARGDRPLLAALLTGAARAALAVPLEAASGLPTGGEFYLLDASAGDLILVWNDGGAGLFEPSAFAGAQPIRALDASVPLQLARLDSAPPSCWVPASAAPLPLVGTVLTAAMLVGIAEAVRDMAVGQALARRQFGSPIGTFQAVKHRCADMALQCEAAWSQTVYAALSLRAGHADAPFQASAAKYVAMAAALAGAADNIQVHGGMGYTAEINAHLFLKRAHLLDHCGGAQRDQQRKLLEYPNAS